ATTERLWESYVAQARAQRFSRQVGQRFESLATLTKAASLGIYPQRRLELRNEAIASLALRDVRLQRPLGVAVGKETDNEYSVAVDPNLERFAYSNREEVIVIRRAADGSEVTRIPAPQRRPAWPTLRFTPDGRWLVIAHRYWPTMNSLPAEFG